MTDDATVQPVEATIKDAEKIELERHSSLRLVFGRCTAWQKVNGKYQEKDSIFDCSSTGRRGHYEGDKFAQSNFWRNTSDRFWQFDDFTFKGIAAASYLINSHRFKIWFNPFEYYKFIYKAVAFSDNLPDDQVDQKELEKIYKKMDEEWEKIVAGKNSKYDSELQKNGFDLVMYNALKRCAERKTWDFDSWIMWNHIVSSCPYVAVNLESVMVHEMYHIIWNHLARVEERDSVQWNLATDYAINQNMNFSDDVQAMVITDKNKSFFRRFILSTIKYLMQSDKAIAKSLKDDFKIDEKTNFDKIDKKQLSNLYTTYMTENQHWQNTNKFANKSADLYYRILLESCIFIDAAGMAGYDKHGKWGDNGADGDGNTVDKDGKTYEKGAADGTEECKKRGGKGKDGEGEDEPDFHTDHDKKRGKGGREEHGGFDPMECAASRREVKSTIKDSLERCGVNPDDPDEIEKALKATPGMGILGALILEWFKIRKKNWRQILKKELTSYANPQDIDYTMSRESRVIPDFFPGKKRERGLDVIVQVDTSGSINYKDWNDFINQIEEIGRSCDTRAVRVLQVHSVIASDEKVNLRRVKQMRIKETGGTTMALGPEMLKREKNKKLLIIFTDGYIDNFEAKDYPFKIIMFLSRGNSQNTETIAERGFMVINQDED